MHLIYLILMMYIKIKILFMTALLCIFFKYFVFNKYRTVINKKVLYILITTPTYCIISLIRQSINYNLNNSNNNLVKLNTNIY